MRNYYSCSKPSGLRTSGTCGKNEETKTTTNKIKNCYERVIRTKKSLFYKTHLDSLRNNLKETWRTIYEITGQQKPFPISSINHDHKTYPDSHTIAKCSIIIIFLRLQMT